MPGGDGTGPMGEGPVTGRGMGRCTGYPVGGYNPAPGWGGGFYRCGRGGGRGWRSRSYRQVRPVYNRFYDEPASGYTEPPVSETDSLKRQVQGVSDAIERIAARVEQLLNRKNKGD